MAQTNCRVFCNTAVIITYLRVNVKRNTEKRNPAHKADILSHGAYCHSVRIIRNCFIFMPYGILSRRGRAAKRAQYSKHTPRKRLLKEHFTQRQLPRVILNIQKRTPIYHQRPFLLFRIHPAGFSTGSSKAKEAAPRRVLRKLGELRSPLPEGNARMGSPLKPCRRNRRAPSSP